MLNHLPCLLAALILFSCAKTPPPAQQSICYTCGTYPYGGGYTHNGRIQTNTSEDWDYWNIGLGDTTGKFQTNTSDDWDYWQFNLASVSGYIQTNSSADWDYWNLNCGSRTIRIQTNSSNDWDYWNITESSTGFSARVQANTSDDFDYWNVYVNGEHIFDIRTNTSNDWDYWNFGTNTFSGMDLPQLAAVLFIPVYTSAIHERGIDL